MNHCYLLLAVVLLAGAGAAQPATDVPQLYTIQQHHFSTSYSCGGNYSTSALFLTQDNVRRNTPDLLYNGPGGTYGSCPMDTEFDITTVVGQMGFIMQLGHRPLEDFNANEILSQRSKWNYEFAEAKVGMSYAFAEVKDNIESVVVFNVTDLSQDGSRSATIMYSVLYYAAMSEDIEAEGFSYSSPSVAAPSLPTPDPLPRNVPELYQIHTHTFSTSYSCFGSNGYNDSALFMTEEALNINDPNLLFYTNEFFEAATAGVDMAWFKPMGQVPLENITANDALSGPFTYNYAPVRLNETYAVVENKDDRQTLYVFNVSSIASPDGCGEVTIFYSPLYYVYSREQTESPGFDWDGRPHGPAQPTPSPSSRSPRRTGRNVL